MESTDIRGFNHYFVFLVSKNDLRSARFNFKIFDFFGFMPIFATFCLILHKFWANKLSKILIYIESNNDSMLLIHRCPRAIIKVFFQNKGEALIPIKGARKNLSRTEFQKTASTAKFLENKKISHYSGLFSEICHLKVSTLSSHDCINILIAKLIKKSKIKRLMRTSYPLNLRLIWGYTQRLPRGFP